MTMSLLEQVELISNDIQQKLSEATIGSETQQLILHKKRILDQYLQKIIDDAQINKYEYECYTLSEKCELLRTKIAKKEKRPSDDDADVVAYKELKSQLTWIQQTKLKDVRLTNLPKKPSHTISLSTLGY